MSVVFRRYISEFLGTFVILFAPIAGVASGRLPGGDDSLLAAAFVAGLVVTAAISAFGPLSAAHFNPAVTLAFASVQRFPRQHVLPYLAAQVLGSLTAATVANTLYGGTGFGTLTPHGGLIVRAFCLEIVLTFVLMLVIMGVATDRRTVAPTPALAVGLTVVVNIFIGGPVSGAAMNPVRTLGPTLLAGGPPLTVLWLYLVGPCLGAVLAAQVYERLLRLAPEHACSVPDM